MADVNEILRLITEYPHQFAVGFDEGEASFGRTYDDSDKNEAYDLGRQLRRSYLFGIRGE